MRRLIRGDVELPAELADVGDAVGAGEAEADLDLARGAERVGGVGEIVRARREARRSRERGPMTGDHGLGGRDVGDDHGRVAEVAAEPVQVALKRRGRNDEEEGRLGEAR